MTSLPLSLEAQLALTLAGVCECRHMVTVHNDKAGPCRFCSCQQFTRRTDNDQQAMDVLAGERVK